MTSRREFVRSGLSTVAAGAAMLRGAHAVPFQPARSTPSIVAIDRTLVTAAVLATAAARDGERVLFFEGDVGTLWLHEIEPLWRTGAAAIAGITGVGVLFCLETLARDYGHGTIERGQVFADGTRGRVEGSGASAALPPIMHDSNAAADAVFAWLIAPLARPRFRGVATAPAPSFNRLLQA